MITVRRRFAASSLISLRLFFPRDPSLGSRGSPVLLIPTAEMKEAHLSPFSSMIRSRKIAAYSNSSIFAASFISFSSLAISA